VKLIFDEIFGSLAVILEEKLAFKKQQTFWVGVKLGVIKPVLNKKYHGNCIIYANGTKIVNKDSSMGEKTKNIKLPTLNTQLNTCLNATSKW